MSGLAPGLIEAESIRQPVPVFAPSYGRGKNSHFSDTDVLIITYRTTRESAASLIPSHLHLEENPLVRTSLIKYGMSSIGTYRELIHQIEVNYNGKTYDYYVLLVLDNEDAVYGGREAYGFPKVMGVVDFDLEKCGSYIQGSVERPAGNPIAEFLFKPSTYHGKGPLPPLKNMSLGLRVIPSPVPGAARPTVRQFLPGKFEFTEGELWEGVGSIKYPSFSELDPLHRLPVVEYESSFLIRHAECVLHAPTEVFDF